MAKRKRKLTAAEKKAKQKRREEYETIFVNGRMKRVRRPPTIDGMSVEEFIRANADPIFLHQEEMWEKLEMEYRPVVGSPVRTLDDRDVVAVITTENDDDLIVGFGIALSEPGAIASLILQRTPKYEFLRPPDEGGVLVSHELHREEDFALLKSLVARGSQIDIETTVRNYRLDVSDVYPEDNAQARDVLRRMHKHGGFTLTL